MLTIKVQVLGIMAQRPSMQASYRKGSGTTMQENQQAAQIAAKRSIFPQMVPYMSSLFLVLVGNDPKVSRLGSLSPWMRDDVECNMQANKHCLHRFFWVFNIPC